MRCGVPQLMKCTIILPPICDRDRLKSALFIDIVFRLHNSLFENEDYTLTDKWLNNLENLCI